AVELRAGYRTDWTGSPKNPITIDIYNNTILNSGAAAATARAILLFDPTNVTPTTFRWRNNLLDQVGNGFPYWASAFQTPATDPPQQPPNPGVWARGGPRGGYGPPQRGSVCGPGGQAVRPASAGHLASYRSRSKPDRRRAGAARFRRPSSSRLGRVEHGGV